MLQKVNKKSSIVGGVVRLLLSTLLQALKPPGQKLGGFLLRRNTMYGKKPMKPAKKPMKPAKPGKYAPKK